MALLKKKSKCNCNPVEFIAAAVILALGLFSLVWGISTQWVTGLDQAVSVFVAYVIGILLIGTGKAIKRDSCRNCTMHG